MAKWDGMVMLVDGEGKRVENENSHLNHHLHQERQQQPEQFNQPHHHRSLPSMSNQYQAIPTSDETSPRESTSSDSQRRQNARPRTVPTPRDFNPPPPASWKRALLLAVIAFLFWFSLRLSNSKNMVKHKSIDEIYKEKIESRYGPNVVHAKRYSNEHKFRPAASPVITERTKDGRIRLRGANPAGVQ
ncbi:hypothetical protein [Phaffia rhodozyma]|uniref:Uncharacterized protein n=1 Tax=Phaffia rhodozyma TaxID=264483 RepID=A0A0F7SVJ5_PHARH|nr:hypothetical protein [Phaffia rhodozyma]